MEEARHWVWAKRKSDLISTNNSHDHHLRHRAASKSTSYDDSWEEQAFAEDAAGTLGGCIWPPRSYSCSFCRREFRSAQALGGHMNVHRRDRARLKQSPPDLHREILNQNHHDHLNNSINPFHQNVSPLMITTSLGNSSSTASKIPQFPSQVCALLYNPNPNISDNHDPNHDSFSSSPPQLCEQNCHHEKQVLFPHNEESNNRHLLLNPSSQRAWSNLGTTERCYRHSSHQKDLSEDQKVSSLAVESGGSCRAKSRDYHHVKTDLSVSLNLVVCRSCPSTLSGGYNIKEDCDHDHSVSTFKRRRVNVHEEEPYPSSQLPSGDNPFLKPSLGDRRDREEFLRKEVLNQRSPCSKKEELDLELRLAIPSP